MSFGEQTVSVVIGSATSLGRAAAQALAERPGKVIVAGAGNPLDVADEWAVGSFFESLGAVDHVIFAGSGRAACGSTASVDFDAARARFDIELWGAISIAREAARHLRPGGSITLIAGAAPLRTETDAFVRSVIRAALGAAVAALARELDPLRVNLVDADSADTAISGRVL